MRISQLARNKNKKNRLKKNLKTNIKHKSQYKGITTAIYTLTPKKPNSALRKVAKVKLNTRTSKNNKIITAYIPGEAHTLTIHNMVLVIPKKTQDLPGVKYKIIRGILDCKAPIRKTKRSKYGVKKTKK